MDARDGDMWPRLRSLCVYRLASEIARPRVRPGHIGATDEWRKLTDEAIPEAEQAIKEMNPLDLLDLIGRTVANA